MDWPVNVSLAPIAPDFAEAMSAEQMLDAVIRQREWNAQVADRGPSHPGTHGLCVGRRIRRCGFVRFGDARSR